MRHRKHARLAAVALTVTMVAAACGSDDDGGTDNTSGSTAAPTGEAVKVGCLTDLGGPFAVYGKPQAAGFQTYIDHINKQGGVNGAPIEAVVTDERSDVQVGTSGWRDFVDSGAIGVFCITSSAIWSAIGDLAEDAKVSQISNSAVDAFTDTVHPYLFKLAATAHMSAFQVGEWLTEWAADNGKDTLKIGWIASDTPAQHGTLDGFKEYAAEKGWEITEEQFFPNGSTDLAAPTAIVVETEPDILVASTVAPGVALILQAARDRGYDGPVLNPNTGGANAQSALAQFADPEYYAFRDFADPKEPDADSPGLQAMKEHAKAAGTEGDMTSFAFTLGYIQAMFAVEALEACGAGCDSEGFRAALETVSIDTQGLSGPVSYSPEKHVMSTTARVWHYDPATQAGVPISEFIDGSGQ